MKRRDFIKKSGLISTGILAGTSTIMALNKNFGPNDSINIGVIGTGSRGQGLIPILNEIKGVNVAACCDILPFRLEEGLKRAGDNTKAYSDYRKLLESKDIDAVLVSTPFSTHSSIAIDAVDVGKHIYCEKTMAKGYTGIKELVKKVHSSNNIFQTGHQFHSSDLYKKVADMIKEGEIGKVILFECQWNRNGDWRRSVPKPSLERAINWRLYREFSGGLTAELSSHQIDFINWVLEENPIKIMGVGGIDYWKDGRETYDNTNLIFEYPSGVKAKFTSLTSNSLSDYQIKVMGSKGTIIMDQSKAWIYYEKGHEKELADVDGVSGATANPHFKRNGALIEESNKNASKLALQEFRNCILNNSQPASSVYTGANTAVAVQMSLDAMYDNKIVHAENKFNFKQK
ncbi:MAG: Gfo/Idh/MocA family oxidoreductase [Bacteroidota bacterium]